MAASRDFGAELDELKAQLDELQALIRQQHASPGKAVAESHAAEGQAGAIYYSGQYRGAESHYRWEPQARSVDQLLELDSDKAAKVLSALGHKQRLDILRTVLQQPMTGAELVERLNMGTTGQLYHHIKALVGAGLLNQEERGAKYTLPVNRALPLLLLLAAGSDLLDTTDYMNMSETRSNAGAYLGSSETDYDPHLLLWSVVENAILEHQAGYCNEVSIFLQGDGSITAADNGRGIPVQSWSGADPSPAQAVFTDLSRYNASASYLAPGAEKGITIPIVNALSAKLSVEIRRDGKIYRQDYKHGIPQTELMTVGITRETGTSVSFQPDRDIFASSFDAGRLTRRSEEIAQAYPGLAIHVHTV